IRNRRKGDWFEPLGTKGSQKIKKLFIDRKVPRGQRESLALIADDVSVIWIENIHISERVKVTHETKNVLILEIRPLG
ncbi:MAG TPA: tRNA lysidine(34) synthetase TilS, partial [Smithellaceae bacterium]|nr:tRNA lysidine(34) synthetase TilS [Smithellaceae bacterium]